MAGVSLNSHECPWLGVREGVTEVRPEAAAAGPGVGDSWHCLEIRVAANPLLMHRVI